MSEEVKKVIKVMSLKKSIVNPCTLLVEIRNDADTKERSDGSSNN